MLAFEKIAVMLSMGSNSAPGGGTDEDDRKGGPTQNRRAYAEPSEFEAIIKPALPLRFERDKCSGTEIVATQSQQA